jgi:hypothetical protein
MSELLLYVGLGISVLGILFQIVPRLLEAWSTRGFIGEFLAPRLNKILFGWTNDLTGQLGLVLVTLGLVVIAVGGLMG